jgi:hypothetical protein
VDFWWSLANAGSRAWNMDGGKTWEMKPGRGDMTHAHMRIPWQRTYVDCGYLSRELIDASSFRRTAPTVVKRGGG